MEATWSCRGDVLRVALCLACLADCGDGMAAGGPGQAGAGAAAGGSGSGHGGDGPRDAAIDRFIRDALPESIGVDSGLTDGGGADVLDGGRRDASAVCPGSPPSCAPYTCTDVGGALAVCGNGSWTCPPGYVDRSTCH